MSCPALLGLLICWSTTNNAGLVNATKCRSVRQNANTINPTCGHLDLRRADNLHSKLWPLASGSSFGDMSGIFHNTEASRAKLVPEDQIVKPRITSTQTTRADFKQTTQQRSQFIDRYWAENVDADNLRERRLLVMRSTATSGSTAVLHCMASLALALSESLLLLRAKTSYLNSGRSVGVGSSCSSCHEGPDDSSVVFGAIFRMNSRTLLSPGPCCFIAAAASTGSSTPLLATGGTLLICGFAPL